jgi:hypothetical protein
MNIFNIELEECAEFVEGYLSKDEFVKDFKNHYSHVLAYHTTKLSLVEYNDIKLNGLSIASFELYKRKAISRFILLNDSDDLKENIFREIDLFLDNSNQYIIGELNFGLIRDYLVNDAYHYLQFGTEGLIGLASEMKQRLGVNFRRRMKEFGVPYLITINVPISKIEIDWIENIYEYLIEGAFEASIVYTENVSQKLIMKIEELEEPKDIYNLLFQ